MDTLNLPMDLLWESAELSQLPSNDYEEICSLNDLDNGKQNISLALQQIYYLKEDAHGPWTQY